MTICNPDGTETILPGDHPISMAHRALEHAAERIGRNNAASYLRSAAFNDLPGVQLSNRKAKRGAYTITPEHRELVEALPALLSGKITPEEAMALLHGYDTMKQRFPA